MSTPDSLTSERVYMPVISQYLGEILALMTALSWAFAVVLFKKSGEVVHPIALNLFKSVLTAVLLIPTMYLIGQSMTYSATRTDYALLLISGALGIGIADTFFFMSLNALGAGLSAIVDCLYSPFIIALSFLWLGESLSPVQMLGAALIVSAVLTATHEGRNHISGPRHVLLGILWGALAMGTMAVGIVMIKPILNRSPLLWVTEIRLIGGIAVLAFILWLRSDRRRIMRSMFARQQWGYTLSGSLIGTYLAMVLWLGGMKYTQASTAAALNQTSNIFIFIFAGLLLKEPITPLRILGIALGVTGAFMVTFG